MEGVELQPVQKCLQNFSNLPLWIIEYAWAHKMMDIQEAVDFSTWQEMDSQALSLEDSWRLRVASAQVYSIVKNRNMKHFERVMGFLESTYRLLPRLVNAIKHMKIMFGLKTMTIMWMLREDRGMVDTVFKINQFFPCKLPQYQYQCSPHEMYLMKKNHLDFKALAHTLAVDKDKRKDYLMNQMEEQFGEHYAQKVEERLLHYLHELETALQGDTYIDKLLKKESPVSEEEKLLLEVICSDSMTIATTLKKLLHCDFVSCSLGRVCQSSDHGKNGMEISRLPKSLLHSSSSKALLRSLETKTPPGFQPDVFMGGEEVDQELSNDSPLWLENDNDSDARRPQQTGKDGEVIESVKEDSSDKEKEKICQRSNELEQEGTSSPQFCSKHQRWVKSILQECPDECPEELRLHALSPPLFQSSSSTGSSQDLTPSDLMPCPPDQQHPAIHLQAVAQPCHQANSEDMLSSGSFRSANDTFKTEPLPQPSSSGDTLLPALLSPVVRLVDIASVRGIYLPFKPHQASPNHSTIFSNKQATSAFGPQVPTSSHQHTSENNAILQGMMKDSTFDKPETVASIKPPNTTHQMEAAPVFQDASTSTSCQPLSQQSFKLSRKYKQACPTTRKSQTLDGQNPLVEQFKMAVTTVWTSSLSLSSDFSVSLPPTQDLYTPTPQSGTLSSVCTANQIPLSSELSRRVVPQSSIKPHAQTHNAISFQSKTLPHTVTSSASNSNCVAARSETSRVQTAPLRLSLTSQAVLLQSKLLQPYVSLTRLTAQYCYQVTMGRCSTRYVEPVIQGRNDGNDKDRRNEKEEEDTDSSFDVNILYSSYSSSGDTEDSFACDPDYKPCIKKQRLLLEYESARVLMDT
uniref:uncharacterized protein LOC124061693 n=1 Tax=Scatophagus argus TaxID=75038 RepID=UPI001ED7D859|nr:uncharacterized protein LOC124061693 [Scatophagus argus]